MGRRENRKQEPATWEDASSGARIDEVARPSRHAPARQWANRACEAVNAGIRPASHPAGHTASP